MDSFIDFHSHVLPGVDDGSHSVEESIQMLRLAAQQGIRQVVATPHFYANHDNPERFLSRRAKAEERLREELSRHDDLPKISIGAEVYYFRGISDSDLLSQLTIVEKKCILIEMPHSPWTENMYRELEAIHEKRGLTPIIAHVDRYIGPLRTFGIPERLAQLPVIVQANAEFFLRRSTARMALRMLRENQIHILGSDCHDMHSRKPNLGPALELIEKRLGQQTIDRVDRFGSALLNGEDVRQLVEQF